MSYPDISFISTGIFSRIVTRIENKIKEYEEEIDNVLDSYRKSNEVKNEEIKIYKERIEQLELLKEVFED